MVDKTDITTDILDEPTQVKTVEKPAEEPKPAKAKAKAPATKAAAIAEQPVEAAHRMESWDTAMADGSPVRVTRDVETGIEQVSEIPEA